MAVLLSCRLIYHIFVCITNIAVHFYDQLLVSHGRTLLRWSHTNILMWNNMLTFRVKRCLLCFWSLIPSKPTASLWNGRKKKTQIDENVGLINYCGGGWAGGFAGKWETHSVSDVSAYEAHPIASYPIQAILSECVPSKFDGWLLNCSQLAERTWSSMTFDKDVDVNGRGKLRNFVSPNVV